MDDEKQSAKPRGGQARFVFEDGSGAAAHRGRDRAAGRRVVRADRTARLTGPAARPPRPGGDRAVTPDRARRAVRRAPDAAARVPARPAGIAGIGTAAGQRGVPPGEALAVRRHRQARRWTAPRRSVTAIHEAVDEGLAYERTRPDMSSSADRPGGVHKRTGEACPVCGDTIREVAVLELHRELLPDLPDRRQGPGRQHHQPLPQVAPSAGAPVATVGPCRSTSGPSPATTPRPCSCPGDPRRAAYIAETFFADARCVNEERGMLGFTGTFEGRPLSVQSTGMGVPERGHRLRGAHPARRHAGWSGSARAAGSSRACTWRTRSSPSPPRPRTARSSRYTNGEPHAPTATWSLVEDGGASRPRAAAPRSTSGSIVSSGVFYDPDPTASAAGASAATSAWRWRRRCCTRSPPSEASRR